MSEAQQDDALLETVLDNLGDSASTLSYEVDLWFSGLSDLKEVCAALEHFRACRAKFCVLSNLEVIEDSHE